jgi:hypothetical protein
MEAPSKYVIDRSRWPLVVLTVPATDPDMPAYERHLVELRALTDSREPFVLVLDARAGGSIPPDQRERLRRHRRETFHERQMYQRAFAMIAESAFQRAVLQAILWLAPEPCPAKIFSTMAEAEAWVTPFLRSGAASAA